MKRLYPGRYLLLILFTGCASAETLTLRGLSLQQDGRLENAEHTYSQAIKKDPSYAPAWHNRGTVWYLLGEPDLALQDFNQAQLLSSAPGTLNNKAGIYLQFGLYESALWNIRQALESGYSNITLFNNRGIALSGEGQWMEALRDYNHILELNPDYAPAYNNRGVLFFKASNLRQAIRDFDRAIALDPTEARFYYNRGLARYANGDAFEALEDLSRAKEMGLEDAVKILEKL